MPLIIAAAVAAALVSAIIAYFVGESNGAEREKGEPRTVCFDYTLVSSTATHADYAAPSGKTYSVRKDELAEKLGRPTMGEFPAKLRVCVTMNGGSVSTTVTVP